jgi:hypothetical protein
MISIQRYKPSTLAYLNIGTGNACASQRKPNPLPVSTSKEFDFEVLGTFGAALPTGSACNRMDRISKNVQVMYINKAT